MKTMIFPQKYVNIGIYSTDGPLFYCTGRSFLAGTEELILFCEMQVSSIKTVNFGCPNR
jgi:hypothetical protein